MEVYKYNSVFDHVDITLRELFSKNSNFDKTVFVLGYNVLKDLSFLRKKYIGYKIIVYQLEQLHSKSQWVNKESYKILTQADEVWDYDQKNIEWMRKFYKINANFLPLVYTDSLKTMDSVNSVNPDIDVLFYGYTQERRAKMMFNLQQKLSGNYKIFNIHGVWGEELNSYISRSKIILNIHSSDIAVQEQVRMYHPVINGRCILSETSDINYMGNSIIQVPYDKIVDATIKLLETKKWKDHALNCSEIYKKMSIDRRNSLKLK